MHNMSSYHSSFKYLEKKSDEDFGWIITHFASNADSGEVDTFLTTSAVYSDSFDGTRQKFYGAKYTSVAEVQITVIKQDGTDFNIDDNRKALRWLTGSRQATWMEFYIGDEVKYRLLGRVKSVSQYKMDARVVGLVLTFESVSPYGYSTLQGARVNVLGTNTTDGWHDKMDDMVDEIHLPCNSDELHSYVYMNMSYQSKQHNVNDNPVGKIIINNKTINEKIEISGLAFDENVQIDDNMVITSDKPNKKIGNTFNFVFPRLKPGVDNEIQIEEGCGVLAFHYIVPIKLGNIAVDINAVSDPICDSEGNIQIDTLDWGRVSNTPTTLSGYGIRDAYTKLEVDAKLSNISIDDVYTKEETYSKAEIDALISSAQITIDEDELNSMLAEVLV